MLGRLPTSLGRLPTPLGNRRRHRARGRIEANLDVARQEVLVRGRAGGTANAERGRERACGLRDDELHLAERAAARQVCLAVVPEETGARGVHRGQVTRAEVGPRDGRQLVRRGVKAKDEARQIADRDVKLVVKRHDALGATN